MVAPLQFSLDNMWITISSGILGFSFIFGNSIRTVFESCLTLFVIHPFDVGDTIFIEGSYHVVEEASLNKVRLIKQCVP
jgi:small-conductance mechanosensitive channel